MGKERPFVPQGKQDVLRPRSGQAGTAKDNIALRQQKLWLAEGSLRRLSTY